MLMIDIHRLDSEMIMMTSRYLTGLLLVLLTDLRIILLPDLLLSTVAMSTSVVTILLLVQFT